MTSFKRLKARCWQTLVWSAATIACASAAGAGSVTVNDAWVRAMPPGQSVTALYFSVKNDSGQACALTSVRVAGAPRTELHRSTDENGVARMRLQESIEVPAHGEAHLVPGGDHVMLFDVDSQLSGGDTVSAELDFGDCGQVAIEAEVRDVAQAHGTSPHHHHHHH